MVTPAARPKTRSVNRSEALANDIVVIPASLLQLAVHDKLGERILRSFHKNGSGDGDDPRMKLFADARWRMKQRQ